MLRFGEAPERGRYADLVEDKDVSRYLFVVPPAWTEHKKPRWICILLR